MSRTNVTVVTFDANRAARTAPMWQYDYGQVLVFEGIELPETYEVQFSNTGCGSGDAVTAIGDADGVEIPNALLTSGEYIYAWIFLHTDTDDGETVYNVVIPVKRRAQPNDQVTPEQESAISQAIAALNAGVTRAEAAAAEAGESADQAETSADEASVGAILSESWAVGGTGTREGEDTNNSKFWSELAQQSAEYSGYVWFDVDDSTGAMMVTVANVLGTQIDFSVNEATGELEVIVL